MGKLRHDNTSYGQEYNPHQGRTQGHVCGFTWPGGSSEWEESTHRCGLGRHKHGDLHICLCGRTHRVPA